MRNKRALRSPSGFRVPRSSFGSARAGAAALCLIAASAMACGNKATPTPDKEPIPPSSAPSAAIVAPTSSPREVEAPAIPTLAMEKFAPGGVHPGGLYPVEGALMVVNEFRVGRIVDENIEWLAKKVPSDNAALGPNTIDSIYGRWPDSIGVVYSSTNGRAPQPTYMPLVGVGVEYTAAPGGGLGEIHGVARLGESFVLAATQYGGAEITTVRGTAARKLQTPEQAGCKEGEIRKSYGPSESPALTPKVIESTPEGSLVSIGLLCGESRRPAAEVWDKAGKSRILDLTRWWKKISYWPKLLKGVGDELWAISDSWAPILHFRNGEFEAVPDLERPNRNLFVSPSGKLHANDGRTIHRYEGGKWIPVGHLAVPGELGTMAMDDKETIWAASGGVYRLRPTPTPAPAAPEGCSTPFVYLYEISSKNDKKFTYPSTRKALSSFPEVDAISLVEFEDGYRGRLGITVTSKAQGEALIAHLRETMKEESPRLLCFEPPKDARKIDMNAKK